MENLELFENFLNEDANITIRSRAFTGPSSYPDVIEYIGISTKNANNQSTNFGKVQKVAFLKKPTGKTTIGISMLKFFEAYLKDLKTADTVTYNQIGGDNLVKKVQYSMNRSI